MISLNITAAPRPLKNSPTPTGETLMGRHGKKYRVDDISIGQHGGAAKQSPESPVAAIRNANNVTPGCP